MKPARRERVPLLLGITGASGSGKTYSALRLATGIRRVVGGKIGFIDTESKRGLHYADRFEFFHVPMDAPFGPLDYLAAIEFCVQQGVTILIVDSMTHEHNGQGGVMDQIDEHLAKKCGDDEACRRRNFMVANVKPKAQRTKLNTRIVQLGINAIFLYRAAEKIKPVTGGEPENMGWTPQTTSPLIWEMTQRFLLEPGCDGVPTFRPDKPGERALTKSPEQFREWFKAGQRLDEDVGERMARWAAGDEQAAIAPAPAAANPAARPAAKPAANLDRDRVEQEIFDAAASLKWTAAQGVLWTRHTFGVSEIARLTDQQLADARDLLIDRTIGESVYDERLADLVAKGRAKAAA